MLRNIWFHTKTTDLQMSGSENINSYLITKSFFFAILQFSKYPVTKLHTL